MSLQINKHVSGSCLNTAGRVRDEKGFTLVGSLIMLVLMAYMGASVVNLSSTDQSTDTNEVAATQALKIGNAGIQYSLDKLNKGLSPDIANKAFGAGSFTVVTDPSASKITVTGQVAQAKKVQVLTADFTQSCIDMDVTAAYQQNKDLKGIELVKKCNASATLTRMKIEWNWGACATGLTCTGTTGTASPSADPAAGKQTICHYPPGNPANAHTISVGEPAVNTHLSQHGDTLGACAGGDTSTAVVCEGFDSQVQACGAAPLGATVRKIVVNGTTIANNVSAVSGAIIDTQDITFTTNRSYPIDQIEFDTALPEGAWYAVTAYFADGSEIRKPFKFGSSAVPDGAVPAPAFSRTGGQVTVVPNKTVSLRVIGSAITCGARGATIPVRVDLGTGNGNNYNSLFNNNPVQGGEIYTTTTAGDVTYKVRGRASLSSCNHFSASYDSTNATQVKTLVNGEQAPALQGYGGQKPITAFLAPYLNAQGKVVLNSNQVIMLFELGVNGSSNSAAADFQDLVILFTIN